MGMRPNTTIATRMERLLGIGKPRPRSRFWLVSCALLAAVSGGWVLRLVFSVGWDEQGFPALGTLFLWLWQLSDVGGSFLFLRRGAGRVLRVFGHAVFLPLSMALYLTHSWFTAPWLFVVQVVGILLAALVLGTMTVVRRARRNWAVRQNG